LENAVRGSWADQIYPFLAKNSVCKYYNTLTNAVVRANRDQKITKKFIQTIMTSTRSSDYAVIKGGGNGVSGRSQSSRQLARGLFPGGKEKEDIRSTKQDDKYGASDIVLPCPGS
jgi:hypothetical protein